MPRLANCNWFCETDFLLFLHPHEHESFTRSEYQQALLSEQVSCGCTGGNVPVVSLSCFMNSFGSFRIVLLSFFYLWSLIADVTLFQIFIERWIFLLFDRNFSNLIDEIFFSACTFNTHMSQPDIKQSSDSQMRETHHTDSGQAHQRRPCGLR